MGLSRKEFTRLVHEHGPALYRLSYRLVGDRDEAEDVVQETFRSAWKSRLRYKPELGGRAWLAAILRRRAADRWRRRRLPSVLAGDMDREFGVEGPEPGEEGYTDEVQEALEQLAPELRETLLLVVVGELTHQEAADLLDVPLGTVLSRVSRARKRLRSYLSAAAE